VFGFQTNSKLDEIRSHEELCRIDFEKREDYRCLRAEMDIEPFLTKENLEQYIALHDEFSNIIS